MSGAFCFLLFKNLAGKYILNLSNIFYKMACGGNGIQLVTMIGVLTIAAAAVILVIVNPIMLSQMGRSAQNMGDTIQNSFNKTAIVDSIEGLRKDINGLHSLVSILNDIKVSLNGLKIEIGDIGHFNSTDIVLAIENVQSSFNSSEVVNAIKNVHTDIVNFGDLFNSTTNSIENIHTDIVNFGDVFNATAVLDGIKNINIHVMTLNKTMNGMCKRTQCDTTA